MLNLRSASSYLGIGELDVCWNGDRGNAIYRASNYFTVIDLQTPPRIFAYCTNVAYCDWDFTRTRCTCRIPYT